MVRNIAVLGSGIGLGFYLPGMVVKYQFKQLGHNVNAFVFEDILKEDKKRNIPEIKKIFQKNYRMALLGQKTINNVSESIDIEKRDAVFKILRENKTDKIICFSGFWVPVIKEYIKENDITIDLCHVDSIESVSWKMYSLPVEKSKHIYFNNWPQCSVLYKLNISNESPIEYDKRENRISAHGGGWGIGDFLEKAKILNEHGFDLDVTINNLVDMKFLNGKNRFFMIKSGWNAWDKDNNGNYTFAPFAEIKENEDVVYNDNGKYPLVYDLIKKNKAIISKPGGGTLLDSFSSCTPLIILKPYGEYEMKNGELWEKLGFGITYEKWEDSNFSISLLEELHLNIMRKRNDVPDYIAECMK